MERAKSRAMRVHSADEAEITEGQPIWYSVSRSLGLLTEHDDHYSQRRLVRMLGTMGTHFEV